MGVVGVVKQYGLETDGKIATYFPQQQQPDQRNVSGGPHRHRTRRTGLSDRERNPRGRSGRGGLRNPDHAGPLVRFAGAAALLEHHAGSVCGVRAAAGGGGSLRRDVVSGDAEHARYRRAGGTGRAAGEHYSAGGAAGNAIGGDRNLAGLVGAVALTRVMASLLFGVSTTDVVTFAGRAGIVSGGRVRGYGYSSVARHQRGSNGRAAGGIVAGIGAAAWLPRS